MRRGNKPKRTKAKRPRKPRGQDAPVASTQSHPDHSSFRQIGEHDDELHVKMQSGTAFQAGKSDQRLAESGCYVYGIMGADTPTSLGKTAIAGELADVFPIHYDGLSAIVSKVATAIIDATRENALAHEHVLERIMNTRTIIPMSFGTVFRSEDDVQQVLKSIYPSLIEVLGKMEGKIEFGLKVNWDRDKVVERLKHENEQIRQFNSELAKKRLQSTYLARMQLGRMIDQALTEHSAEIVKEIYERLRPVCVASRDNKPIGEKMILNAAFLLERTKEAEFDRIVNQISKRFKELLTFRYSGPWPPYNFVNIRLKLETAQVS